MSSKIYFQKNAKLNVRRTMVNLSTRLHHRLAPQHAKKVAMKVLLTPERNRRQIEAPAGLIRQPVVTSEGTMMTYRLGEGPTWVLGHGWSGSAAQFFPLMAHIAAAGYTALAFDNPAHGESEGQYGHLPGFIRALDDVLEAQTHIAGVVAHSMGGAMVLESAHACLRGKPVLLVAPVLNYADNLISAVQHSGYSMRLFNEVVEDIAQAYQYPLNAIDPEAKLQQWQGKVVIVHDRQDRFAAFTESEAAAVLNHVTLIATEGLGHGRILQSEQLRHGFDVLLAS